MSNLLAYADLQARLNAADLGLPIAWPNEPFDLPEPAGPWLLVELSGGAAQPIELGDGVWVTEGQAWVHVQVPIESGAMRAFGLVDAVSEMFRSPPVQPVTYTRVASDPGGPAEGNGLYWRTSVLAEWRTQTFLPRG